MSTTFPAPLRQAAFEEALGRPLISREEFIADIGAAVRDRTGFAAGKLGVSERAWMYYPTLLASGAPRIQVRAFEQTLYIKATRHAGLFPADAGFYREFVEFYAERLRQTDCIGLDPAAFQITLDIVRFHSLGADLMRYKEQEPDRSSPAHDERCYTPHFSGKRLLLVCPFADALRARATKETFEAVWAKTGKKWFEPASIEALEFPYGFARETQARYGTCLDLLAEIEQRVDEYDYDVALIAAGGLGVPIASHVRSRGRVALSLGGALQVLFGVFGSRWAGRPDWRERYFTDAWVPVPEKYRPDMSETDEDYW
ncbi:MAG: hypothetical protein QOF65_87 [Thermoleophilaceae bacterium]|nr:hypothetical protein [Thermoleophilaceae bacterium]